MTFDSASFYEAVIEGNDLYEHDNEVCGKEQT